MSDTTASNPLLRAKKARTPRTGPDGQPLRSVHQPAAVALHVVDPGDPDEIYNAPTDPAEVRATQAVLYRDSFAARTSNRGRPFAPSTVVAYCEAARSLNEYLTGIGFQGGFQDMEYTDLNNYLAAYHDANGQGGTVTKLGNLRPFFEYVAEQYDVPNIYQHSKRNRYRRGHEAPPVLPDEFIVDLLAVMSGPSFEDRRDTLIVHLFLLGPRNAEIQSLLTTDLNVREGYILFPPVKHADNPRKVHLPLETRQAAERYLQARARHKARPARNGPLLYGLKRFTPMTKSGIYQMIKKRTVQAGYDPDGVHPHLFRHTAVDKWLAAGLQEGDALYTFGWSVNSRNLLDRYGVSNRGNRAFAAGVTANFGAPPKR